MLFLCIRVFRIIGIVLCFIEIISPSTVSMDLLKINATELIKSKMPTRIKLRGIKLNRKTIIFKRIRSPFNSSLKPMLIKLPPINTVNPVQIILKINIIIPDVLFNFFSIVSKWGSLRMIVFFFS